MGIPPIFSGTNDALLHWERDASYMTENISQGNHHPYDFELHFTEVYRQYQEEHVAIREAMCLKAMYPSLLEGIKEGDLFAGRVKYKLIGFGLEQDSGGRGGFGIRHEEADRKLFDEIIRSISDLEYRRRVAEMFDFWEKETTRNKFINSLPEDLKRDVTNRIASGSGIRLAGVLLNFDKLLQMGLPGLIAEVGRFKAEALKEGKDVKLYEGMEIALQLLIDVCHYYIGHAKELMQKAFNDNWKKELSAIIKTFEKITVSKPENLRDAIQLFWLYALMSSVVNYGRMDVYLGDFYVKDIDSGLITEEQALKMLQSLWRLIADRKIVFNGRIIVGGLGRRNEKNADRFALAAMEATRTVVETEPQLTLRFYKGMDLRLMKKALDVIGEGRIYPMLYHDDVNVPAVQKAFGVSREDAEQYLPYGCGEYALDHISLGSPNSVLNLMKALEAALHNGKDGLIGMPLGLKTGEFNSFKTFEELFDAYKKQVEYYAKALALRHVYEYKTERENAAYLYASILYDYCIERGRSIVDGGAKYQGGITESFGIVNVADSLAAIKLLVYDQKLLTHDQLLAVLDANFEGYERERQMMLDAPKYGNDHEYVDRIAQEVSNHASRFVRAQASGVGLDYFLIVNINNFVNVTIGKTTAASADGRKAGDPYANGNTPTAGMDRKGVTAFLNSLSKLDPGAHAGYVQNMKFTRQMFTTERAKLEVLLDIYFKKGGTQAMITVVNRGDLENAMKEPEKYANLIVRVGGYSARFVELQKDIQMDILKRTLY